MRHDEWFAVLGFCSISTPNFNICTTTTLRWLVISVEDRSMLSVLWGGAVGAGFTLQAAVLQVVLVGLPLLPGLCVPGGGSQGNPPIPPYYLEGDLCSTFEHNRGIKATLKRWGAWRMASVSSSGDWSTWAGFLWRNIHCYTSKRTFCLYC